MEIWYNKNFRQTKLKNPVVKNDNDESGGSHKELVCCVSACSQLDDFEASTCKFFFFQSSFCRVWPLKLLKTTDTEQECNCTVSAKVK